MGLQRGQYGEQRDRKSSKEKKKAWKMYLNNKTPGNYDKRTSERINVKNQINMSKEKHEQTLGKNYKNL